MKDESNNAEDPVIGEIAERMRTIKHKILILSGKGGVGKSTFTVTLARTIAESDRSKTVSSSITQTSVILLCIIIIIIIIALAVLYYVH